MNQVPTWLEMLAYSIAPLTAATLLAFVVLWVAHARALKFAGTSLRGHRMYAALSTVVLLILGWILSSGTIDTWTVVRHFGGHNLPIDATSWRDSVFNQPLRFYLFDRHASLRTICSADPLYSTGRMGAYLRCHRRHTLRARAALSNQP